jgi:26S proteasome regulatory subunit N2
VYHCAVTFANAFMNAGTTSDQFLRENMEWLSRATNWAKFSATAQLGVIHKVNAGCLNPFSWRSGIDFLSCFQGNVANGMNLLQPYLPQDGVSGSAYSEGGSLYALGLIHANNGGSVIEYLRKHLKQTQTEVIQHGAALGLGVAGMATDNDGKKFGLFNCDVDN